VWRGWSSRAGFDYVSKLEETLANERTIIVVVVVARRPLRS